MAPDIYFEDIELDRTEEFGSIRVERDEVIRFARRFDPQPFHLDDAAARDSLFGALAASGWHTASMMMRLVVDHRLKRTAGLGSPGWDDLKWLRPVYPGDVLRVRSTCIEKRPSRSRPNMGVTRHAMEVLNQNGEMVMSVVGIELVERRRGG